MLTFKTADAAGLLKDFKKALADKRIVTWSRDSDGDFTYNTDEWRDKAWFGPSVAPGELRLGFLLSRDFVLTNEIYAVFHSRFIETMLVHFDKSFTDATASGSPGFADVVA